MLGEFFLERGANLESRSAHTHPKIPKCPPPGGLSAICVGRFKRFDKIIRDYP